LKGHLTSKAEIAVDVISERDAMQIQQEHPLYKEKKPATSICFFSQPISHMIAWQFEIRFAQFLLDSKTFVLEPKGQCSLLLAKVRR
jgi:hypothetical protein